MDKNLIIGILITLAGLFSLISSIKNWDFFFESYRARFVARIIGRTGARIFYGILGSSLCVLGLLLTFNLIE